MQGAGKGNVDADALYGGAVESSGGLSQLHSGAGDHLLTPNLGMGHTSSALRPRLEHPVSIPNPIPGRSPSVVLSAEEQEKKKKTADALKATLYAPLTEAERMRFVRAAGKDILKRRATLPEITEPWLFADDELVQEAKTMLQARGWTEDLE